MKKLLLLVLVLSMGACSTEPDYEQTGPKYKYEIYDNPSTKEMNRNDTEKLLEDTEWSVNNLIAFKEQNYKFIYDPIEGKRIISISTNKILRTISEYRHSYKIVENVWGSGKHSMFPNKESIESTDTPSDGGLELIFFDNNNKMFWTLKIDKDKQLPYALFIKKLK